MPSPQGIFWIATIPHAGFTPYLPDGVSWIRGQLELGEGGFLHWQICFSLCRKGTVQAGRRIFGPWHLELTRSAAARDYVWKEETRVAGTQFELGTRPIQRNDRKDWDAIWAAACKGDLLCIPASVRVQSYRTLRAISADYAEPVGMVRSCKVFWGDTGTGKSRRAWDEAGMDSYPKDPNTKFWCGYRGQERVIIDEFRGSISINHLLRWLDRYPVIVEIKGSSQCLLAREFWITSNLHPRFWYPELDATTYLALERRLVITEIL